jgi:hypothetical protein
MRRQRVVFVAAFYAADNQYNHLLHRGIPVCSAIFYVVRKSLYVIRNAIYHSLKIKFVSRIRIVGENPTESFLLSYSTTWAPLL